MEAEILRNKLYKVMVIGCEGYRVNENAREPLLLLPVCKRKTWTTTYSHFVKHHHLYTSLLLNNISFCFLKAYLESFHSFCKNLGGATKNIMCPVLEVG